MKTLKTLMLVACASVITTSAQAGKRGNPTCLVKTTQAVLKSPRGGSPSTVTHVAKGDKVTLHETFMMDGKLVADVYESTVADGYSALTLRSNLVCLPPKASDD